MPDGVQQTGRAASAGAVWRALATAGNRKAGLQPLTRQASEAGAASLAKPDALQTSRRPARGTVAAVAETIKNGVNLPVKIQEQTGNACGTTSLSMVLKYFGVPAAASDVKAIDRAIRPSSRDAKIDSFTAPLDIALYAQRQGMRATLHNNSSTKDLEAMLAQGVPPMILYDWDAPTGNGLHYVVVTGHRERDGKKEWQLHDPSGYSWHITDAELNRRWSNLHVAGVEIPYNRLMLTISPSQGNLKTPVGTTKEASDIMLPAHNTSTVVDFAGKVATWGVGVGADAYDAGRWIAGKAQAGAAKVHQGWKAVTGLVR
jgi:hypothetical protein